MPKENDNPLVGEARALLDEAREVVGGGGAAPTAADGSQEEGGGGVLDLYERLTKRLEAVDDDKISGLLSSIGKRVEDLEQLARDMDRLARVKRNLSDL
jgi:hypothetical protein